MRAHLRPIKALFLHCFSFRGKWGFGEGKVPKRRLMKALSPGVPAAEIFLINASIVHAADECRPKPDSTAPSGSRWVYRINRADHRHCWFLSSKAGVPRSYSAQTTNTIKGLNRNVCYKTKKRVIQLRRQTILLPRWLLSPCSNPLSHRLSSRR